MGRICIDIVEGKDIPGRGDGRSKNGGGGRTCKVHVERYVDSKGYPPADMCGEGGLMLSISI